MSRFSRFLYNENLKLGKIELQSFAHFQSNNGVNDLFFFPSSSLVSHLSFYYVSSSCDYYGCINFQSQQDESNRAITKKKLKRKHMADCFNQFDVTESNRFANFLLILFRKSLEFFFLLSTILNCSDYNSLNQ